MAIKPCINPYTAAGKPSPKAALKLAAMEFVMALDRDAELCRDFTMGEVDESLRDEVRWCWDNSLLEIVGASPLTYRVTCLGYELVAKAQAQRESMESRVAA